MSRNLPLALLFALAACGPSADVGGGAVEPLAQAAAAPQARRIVPASARAIEFLADLVGPERVAGLPEQGFEYATLGVDEARWKELPRFTAYVAEPVLALGPDLVLCDPWQSVDTNQDLGRVLGVEERARASVAGLERRVAALAERTALRGRLRAMSYSNFGGQGFGAGTDTTIDEILRLAGLENAAATAGRVGHVNMTFEELILIDPDVIVVGTPLHTEAGHAGDRGGASEAVLLSEPSLADLRAVRGQRIARLAPGLMACASQRVVDAAEALATELERLDAEGKR
jgi:ABC-type Fe3+-hydroxamate transport system substrate-binding protein